MCKKQVLVLAGTRSATDVRATRDNHRRVNTVLSTVGSVSPLDSR